MDSKSGGLGGIPQDFTGMVGLSSGGHIYANMPPQESENDFIINQTYCYLT